MPRAAPRRLSSVRSWRSGRRRDVSLGAGALGVLNRLLDQGRTRRPHAFLRSGHAAGARRKSAIETSGRAFPVVSFGYLPVERPFYKVYGINCRPKLGAKLLSSAAAVLPISIIRGSPNAEATLSSSACRRFATLSSKLIQRFNDISPYRLDCLVTLRRKVGPSLRLVERLCLLDAIPFR